jgi:hypothetical protein
MADFSLTIVTPEGNVFDGQVEYVSAMGIVGSLGILANHAPMICALKAGAAPWKSAPIKKSCSCSTTPIPAIPPKPPRRRLKNSSIFFKLFGVRELVPAFAQ